MSSRISQAFVMTFRSRYERTSNFTVRSVFACGTMAAICMLLSILPGTVQAQGIEKSVLDSVKESTVYIKIKAGKVQGSGSGFVFKILSDSVLVMTNRHVAVPDPDEIGPGEKTELTVVFRSGTPQEQELPATIRSYGYGEVADLAVLEVKGLRQIPEPIKADLGMTESEIYETMQSYAIGFPLGGQIQQISGNVKQNPAVTVNAMTISSLRRDDKGQLVRVQFAGSIIGGNSGGPVVNAKGRLVGVVVSRLAGENVGFAVANNVIAEFLSGTLGEPLLVEALGSIGPETQLRFVMRMIDPLKRVNSMGISYSHQPIPPEGFKPVPGGRGGFPMMPGATTVKMMRDGDTASVTFNLPIRRPEDRKIHVQFIKYDFTGAVVANSMPIPVKIPDRPGKILDLNETEKAKTLVNWSCETNLGEGIKMTHKQGLTTINVPPGAYNNSPSYELFNAPCALAKVDGDFIAVVEVGNTFDPGGEGIQLPNGRKIPFAFQSAGLLIWQDERNFVRFERNKRSERGIAMVNQVLLEVYKNGKSVVTHYIDINEQPVGIAAIRKGGSLKLLFALPPKELVYFDEMAIDFQKEIFVGVAATNLSRRPFEANLIGFQLMNLEKTPLEVKPFKLAKLVESGSVRLPNGTFVYEGAALRSLAKDTSQIVQQTNMSEFKGEWTDGRQMLWNNDKPDGSVSFELPVEVDGTFDFKAKFTMAPDYAIAKFDLDGRPLYKGGKVDFYSQEVRPTSLMSLGTVSLKKGKHKLTITTFKKNPKSSGYHFGLDEIQLVPTK